MNFKRFFSTILLLGFVASTLVISSDYNRVNNENGIRQAAELDKSIDLTDSDRFEAKRNMLFVNIISN